jgi:hypothetical protein
MPVTAKEGVSAAINNELSVGASATDIENFFQRHNIRFAWNRLAERYEAVIPEVEPFDGITIRVFVDSERRFISAEVQDGYTAP